MIQIIGKKSDLGGGMFIQRILPNVKKRMVGPFCFLDHMGPIMTEPGANTDVRPHPHIGLSTLTYLFEGRMVHRDSLGSVVEIEPGEVNWMTAGKGISHSERAPENEKGKPRRLHGLQFWVALPDGKEEIDPSFRHYNKNQIPFHENDERQITLVAGQGFGLESQVETSSPLIFANLYAKKDFKFELSMANFELAILVIKGSAQSENLEILENQMLVFEQGVPVKMDISKDCHFVLIGGEPFKTERHIWWNLVSSSREKIEEAKRRWKNGSFPMVPGETEFIPLPE
jgi:redox-sensitive bicupin YhaK (pirin superfamily)